MQMLEPVLDGNTKVVAVSFFDEANVAMIPTTVNWSLYDEDGVIVNSRSNVSISPASTVNIVLSGADTLFVSPASQRILVVNAIYTGVYGVGLPLKDYFKFTVLPISTTA